MRSTALAVSLAAVLAALLAATACGEGSPGAGDESELRPLPPGTTVAVRRHKEVVASGARGLIPVFLGTDSPAGLCLVAPASVDASQWEAVLVFRGISGSSKDPEPVAPVARSGQVLCFETAWPPRAPQTSDFKLCGRLIDKYDGASFEIPCTPARLVPTSVARDGLLGRLGDLIQKRHEEPREQFSRALEDLAAEARAEGFLWLAVQIQLISAHYLIEERKPENLAAARWLLASLPAWVEQGAVHSLTADAAYLTGRLDLAEGTDLEAAWNQFRTAEDHYSRVIDRKRLATALGQAEILARVGAVQEAARRLQDALADCAEEDPPPTHNERGFSPSPRGACSPAQRQAAHGMAAWLTLLDPSASRTELEAAENHLATILAAPSLEPLERANQLINLALLRTRRGESPGEALAKARGLLGSQGGGSRKSELLRAWSELVEALHELTIETGDLERAATLCEEVVNAGLTPRLTAWALSCTGRVHQRQGDPERAAWAFDQALAHHEHATPERLGQLLPLGPGQRTDDFYRAARLALEQGAGKRAWEILADLDRLAVDEEACRRSRDQGEEAPEPRAERQRLLRRLAALDAPAQRRGAQETLRPILERLRELAAPCIPRHAAIPSPAGPSAAAQESLPGYRAFALDDEIFLLHRDASGRVGLVRRTPLPRGGVREATDALRRALDQRTVDDERWRALTAPLAAALMPALGPEPGPSARETGGAETSPPWISYRLHGLLQSVPLEALPAGGGDPPRWLGDLVTPVVHPAGLRSGRPAPAGPRAPLFVVDPAQNLARREELLGFYGSRFPGGRLLVGAAATTAAFRRALATAEWLHADTHGIYDPAFPEHSSLDLADGSVTLLELADLPMHLDFANLSSCRTGSWPTTADSGRYGIGGLLARRGAHWVIASRADLLNRLALDFNPAFYDAIRAGEPVPQAYRRAMAEVRRHHPAATWAALFLIGGAPDAEADE